MRILIDVQTLYTQERNRGIGIYTYFWLKNFAKLGHDHRLYLMRKRENNWEFTFISPFIDLDLRLSNDDNWETTNLEDFIKENKVDIVHFTSPYMLDIDVPDIQHINVRKTYLVYDLIPLVMKEHYYDLWPYHIQKIYNYRSQMIRSADLILTISQSSKNDLVSHLGINEEKVKVIYASTNEELYDKTLTGDEMNILRNELNISEPFIFSLTGYDERKNNRGLIAAFAKIATNNPNLKLVIGGIKQAEEREEFFQLSREVGIKDSQLSILGYVSEEIMLALYKTCKVFVFPSLYEGFGLPVLEAMRCGAPVITSNNSSLIEIVEEAGILVDPLDQTKLANAIDQVVNNSELSKSMGEKSLTLSKNFSWVNTTTASLKVFEQLIRKAELDFGGDKPILAFFSPLNPQSSGISDYSEELLLYLKEYFEIKIFVNGYTLTNDFVTDNFEVIDYSFNDNLLESIKYRIYHLGNNELHDWIYEALKQYPGVVVLHDMNLFGFYLFTTFLRGKKEEFRTEMIYNHGSRGLEASTQLVKSGTYPDSQEFPMYKKVVELSTGVIVHSEWVKENLMLYTDFLGKMNVVPSGVVFEEENNIEVEQVTMDPNRLSIGVFGNVIPNKRVDVIIRSFAALLKTNPNTDLYIVGHAEQTIKDELISLIKQFHIENCVHFVEFPDINLFKAYIKAIDICINLRWPTMGETSATLMRALGYGKPCIVSNVGSYKEYPDDCVWKVDVDNSEEEMLLAYLIELCNNDMLRHEMSEISKSYMESNHDFGIAAKNYSDFIFGNTK
jgi:glycosyltransferase involved in cell wall biosynthesis